MPHSCEPSSTSTSSALTTNASPRWATRPVSTALHLELATDGLRIDVERLCSGRPCSAPSLVRRGSCDRLLIRLSVNPSQRYSSSAVARVVGERQHGQRIDDAAGAAASARRRTAPSRTRRAASGVDTATACAGGRAAGAATAGWRSRRASSSARSDAAQLLQQPRAGLIALRACSCAAPSGRCDPARSGTCGQRRGSWRSSAAMTSAAGRALERRLAREHLVEDARRGRRRPHARRSPRLAPARAPCTGPCPSRRLPRSRARGSATSAACAISAWPVSLARPKSSTFT